MEGVVTLSAEQVTSILSTSELICAIENGLANFSNGTEGGVVQPVRSVVKVPKPAEADSDGFFGVMPVYSRCDNALACKLVSFYPGNAAAGKPTHLATILLLDPVYGELKAIMDGEVITAQRTAAASAVASKLLVPNDKPIKLALLGAGVQARSHHKALGQIFTFLQVSVWSRTMESTMKCADELGGEACLSAQEAVTDADIIVTATSTKAPVLKLSWVKEGAHINAVGACRPDWQEIDPELMNKAVVYVDSRDAAMKESGDVIISKAEIYAEIGEVVNGRKPAKRGRATVFKSLGMGLEDAIAAKLVYDAYMMRQTSNSRL